MKIDAACKDDKALHELRVEWFGAADRGGWDAADLSAQEVAVWFMLIRCTGFHGLASAFLADIGGPTKLRRKTVEACLRSLAEKDMLKAIEPETRYSPGVYRLATRPGRYIFGRSARGRRKPD